MSTLTINNSEVINNWSLLYTNNAQNVNLKLQIQGDVVYNGNYTSDPLVGVSNFIPFQDKVVILEASGVTFSSALLYINGDMSNPVSGQSGIGTSAVSWTTTRLGQINHILINFITSSLPLMYSFPMYLNTNLTKDTGLCNTNNLKGCYENPPVSGSIIRNVDRTPVTGLHFATIQWGGSVGEQMTWTVDSVTGALISQTTCK